MRKTVKNNNILQLLKGSVTLLLRGTTSSYILSHHLYLSTLHLFSRIKSNLLLKNLFVLVSSSNFFSPKGR